MEGACPEKHLSWLPSSPFFFSFLFFDVSLGQLFSLFFLLFGGGGTPLLPNSNHMEFRWIQALLMDLGAPIKIHMQSQAIVDELV